MTCRLRGVSGRATHPARLSDASAVAVVIVAVAVVVIMAAAVVVSVPIAAAVAVGIMAAAIAAPVARTVAVAEAEAGVAVVTRAPPVPRSAHRPAPIVPRPAGVTRRGGGGCGGRSGGKHPYEAKRGKQAFPNHDDTLLLSPARGSAGASIGAEIGASGLNRV